MGNCCGGEEESHAMTIDNKGTKGGKGTANAQGAYAIDQEDDNTDITSYCNSKVRSILNDLDDFVIPQVKDNI
jgi:carbon monoxide dehydrogenase subunit G